MLNAPCKCLTPLCSQMTAPTTNSPNASLLAIDIWQRRYFVRLQRRFFVPKVTSSLRRAFSDAATSHDISLPRSFRLTASRHGLPGARWSPAYSGSPSDRYPASIGALACLTHTVYQIQLQPSYRSSPVSMAALAPNHP